MEFHIKLIEEHTRPIRSKSRPIPHSLKEPVRTAIFEQLNAGLIRHSKSEWASPLHIVMKQDGTIRITVDYKRLNNVIEFDPYPMPNASQMYEELADSSWFSKFDFYKAYHQIPVAPVCIKYTAFICEWGLFEYPSMPLGIKTAAAWFQRCIDITFQALIIKGSLRGFLDDMVLFSKNLQEHLADALDLVQIMKSATLKVSLKKCELAQEEITFLGKVISKSKVRNCPKRAECIRNMPLASTYKSLQSALGIFNYQRPFIDKYADLAQPLYDMLELKSIPRNFIKSNGLANGKYVLPWTAAQISQFEIMKQATSDSLELYHPDFRFHMNIRADASDKGYGGYVFQDIEGKRQVLGFHSKTYTRAQRNYSAGERELLSIYKLIEVFHTILFGRHFTVYTDHLPLTFLFSKAEPSKRLQRWFENLAIYSFTIKYIPGKENIVADALSRLYDDEDSPETAFSDEDFNDIILANLHKEFPDHKPHNKAEAPDASSASTLIATLNTSQDNGAYEAHAQQQQADPDLTWIKDLINRHGESRPILTSFANSIHRMLYKEYEELRIIDDILYLETEDPIGNTSLRYVLPAHLVDQVLFAPHNTVYGGHLGRKRTKHKALERFYRPGLATAIAKYVNQCPECQKSKTSRKKTRAEMLVMKPTYTNQIIASDFAGPFNLSRRNNRYIQIVTDLFSKYTIIIAQPNKETKTAAKGIVEQWCCIFGLPIACLTDQGREYQSQLWDALCELWDIERLKTTPYHPEADGQSEKRVQTTKSMITAYVDQTKQDDWDEYLPYLTLAYNTGVHCTTKFSSFEAMFGRKPKLPIDLIFPLVNQPRQILTEATSPIPGLDILDEHRTVLKPAVEENIASLKQHLSYIGIALSRNRDMVMDKAKVRHDRRIKKESYAIGEWVLCSHPKIAKGMKKGIAFKYYGPFRVTAVDENGCNYTIKREGKKDRNKRVHKNNLKIFFKRETANPLAADTSPVRRNEHLATLPSRATNNTQEQFSVNNPNASEDSEDEPIIRIRKPYTKNPLHPRWNKPSIRQPLPPRQPPPPRQHASSSDTERGNRPSTGRKKSAPNVAPNQSTSDSTEAVAIKRTRKPYTKNPNNTRWNKKHTNRQPLLPRQNITPSETESDQPGNSIPDKISSAKPSESPATKDSFTVEGIRELIKDYMSKMPPAEDRTVRQKGL
jgi:transposase InsO family protein